jgi:hypothetical protein
MSREDALFKFKRNEWKFAALGLVLGTVAMVVMLFLRFKNHVVYGQIVIDLLVVGELFFVLKYRSLRAKYRKSL